MKIVRARDFSRLYDLHHEHFITTSSTGSEPKIQYAPKNIFFRTRCTLKTWHDVEHNDGYFSYQNSTFDQFPHKFVETVSLFIYEYFAVNATNFGLQQNCKKQNLGFYFLSNARYATYVIFQQCFRPSRSTQKGKLYFVSKHKLHRLWVELSYLQNGLAFYSSHCSRSVAEILNMRKYFEVHDFACC